MSKRRGNGEGSIYQRADGLWCARVSLGSGVDGKRRRRAVYGRTKREVQNKLGELSHRARNGTLTDPTRITVEAYLDRWLDKSARLHVRASTLESYRSIVRLHIAPVIGGFPLQKLTALDIEALYASMEKVGKSPRMRQYTHAVLRRATRQSR